jgi:tRNA pseudouridine38-40 synthase
MRGSMSGDVRTLKITLAYDGAAYVGWQRQAGGTSIQGLLEDAIARIEGHAVTVHGAGRTDAGVHALAQVASFRVSSTLGCDVYLRALNAMLPEDIRVRRVDEAADDFHARFHARAKTYRYRVLNGPIASPFDARYAWHVSYALDITAMRGALAHCVGEHDFAAFQGAGGAARNTVRTIHDATITQTQGNDRWPAPDEADSLLLITLTGDGFLRHMVRNIAGTLIDIGRGRWPPDELPAILISRDRARAGPTAPPQGLFLVNVDY